MARPWWTRSTVAVALLSMWALALPATAHEGQWMPQQIAELDENELRGLGLELKPSALWNPDDGGLMAAVVNLSGCSAGFISPEGLIATNHHCAYGAIQAQSTVEHDYLAQGFLAASRDQELPAKGKTVRILQSIEDVTAQVRAVADAQKDPTKRAQAVDKTEKELEAACEAEGEGLRCQVASFYSGSRFHLFSYLELSDVRLVYAPPSSIGNYGGEVDNWMWPRHTGDFTLLRAYVGPDGKPAPHSEDNVPYRPRRHLPPSPDGVKPGDFVAVLGYPGHTDRFLAADEVQRQLDQFLPRRIELYGEWIDILEKAGAADPAVEIKVAAKLRSLANRHKNARGMLDGAEKIGVAQARRTEEEAMARWAKQQGRAEHAAALEEMRALAKERRAGFEAEFLLQHASQAGNALDIAIDLVRRAKEARKPDLERRSQYMDKSADRLWSSLERNLRDYEASVDEALGRAWLDRVQALPAAQRFTDVSAKQLPAMLRRSAVTDPDFVKATFDAADYAALEDSRDPMIVWARELVEAIESHEAVKEARTGRMLAAGPLYFEMIEAVRTGPVYPDANSTLRFSYATVQGYAPADGLQAVPQTTLAGQIAKHTGQEPFDLPQAIIDAAAGASATYWADPGLGDVPVAFLSNADTTGGNSGSPVIDGKGRFVGLNFDRVWENIAGDFGWRQDRSRNITVDARYLLWVLDEVIGAQALLAELGVAEQAEAPARPRTAEPLEEGTGDIGVPVQAAAAQQEDDPEPSTGPGCGCRTDRSGSATAGLLLLALVGLRRRFHSC